MTPHLVRNGWTIDRMVAAIEKYVPPEGAWDSDLGYCRYERTDGCRCAVGALFEDDLPAEWARASISAWGMVEMKGSDILHRMPLDLDGLCALQNWHDRHATPDPSNPGPCEDVPAKLVAWIREHCEEAPQ